LKDILKKHGIKIGIAVFAAVLIVLLSAYFASGRSNFLENAIDTVMQPFEKGAAKVTGWLENAYGALYKYDRLEAENRDLKIYIEELEAQAKDYTAAIEENARLRELLDFRSKTDGLQFSSATVTSWSASNWSMFLTISIGTNSDVAADDCVIDEFGNLIGVVTEVSSTSATVRVLIDPSFEAGAMVERNGGAAIVQGEFTLMQNGLLRLSYLPSGVDILNGDIVITSGKGGVLPRGITVGTVQAVKDDASGLTQYAVIKPSVDLSAISSVFVVTDFELTE